MLLHCYSGRSLVRYFLYETDLYWPCCIKQAHKEVLTQWCTFSKIVKNISKKCPINIKNHRISFFNRSHPRPLFGLLLQSFLLTQLQQTYWRSIGHVRALLTRLIFKSGINSTTEGVQGRFAPLSLSIYKQESTTGLVIVLAFIYLAQYFPKIKARWPQQKFARSKLVSKIQSTITQ